MAVYGNGMQAMLYTQSDTEYSMIFARVPTGNIVKFNVFAPCKELGRAL